MYELRLPNADVHQKPKWNKEVPCTNVSCCSNPFCPKLHRLSRTTTKGRARPSFDPAKHNAAKAMAQGSQDPYPPATWLAWAVDTGMTMHWSGVPWTCSGKLGRLRSGRDWMEITIYIYICIYVVIYIYISYHISNNMFFSLGIGYPRHWCFLKQIKSKSAIFRLTQTSEYWFYRSQFSLHCITISIG